jgi:short-subunit dehydrogenase involved in D-alanine esterification of teichoic acids
MPPIYKKTLIIGATSGIGLALSEKLIAEGTFVIATGRRQDRLDAFTAKHRGGIRKVATAIALDVRELDTLPAFAKSVTERHPDLDSIIINAGIQRPFNFAAPESVDFGSFGDELLTNYTAVVHLVTAFLPHLQHLGREGKETHLVFIGASLGLVPTMLRTPGYNASKAALHSFVVNLREQLRQNGDRVRCVEVFPPAVQTELHDTNHQPDLVNGDKIGMPLDVYTEHLYKGLEEGHEQFATGPAEPWLEVGGFEAARQRIYNELHPLISKSLAPFSNK